MSARSDEAVADDVRRLAAGILAGLPLGMARPLPRTEVDVRDASIGRCTCGAWRVRGRACDTCGARPWLGAS